MDEVMRPEWTKGRLHEYMPGMPTWDLECLKGPEAEEARKLFDKCRADLNEKPMGEVDEEVGG